MAKIKHTRLTAKINRIQTKVSRINDFVTTHNTTFVAGNSFDYKWLESNLQWLVPNLGSLSNHIGQDYVARMSAYVQLNRVLAFRGLKIRSQNYYSNFIIEDIATADKSSKKYTTQGTNKIISGTELSQGISSSNGVWSKYSKREVASISTRLIGRLPI